MAAKVDALMDGLRADLVRLAAIPSVAFPGFPGEPVREAHDVLVGLSRGAGVEHIERIDLGVMFSEPRNTVVALCAFVERYAAGFRGRGGAAAV